MTAASGPNLDEGGRFGGRGAGTEPRNPLRSFLFVPGDSERKQAKALTTEADALILDLEDSVAGERLPAARAMVQELLRAEGGRARPRLWVRVNALCSGRLFEDLAAVLPGRPAGLVLPKVDGFEDIVRVSLLLETAEAEHGLPSGSTRLLPIVTETPAGLLALAGYPKAAAAQPASARRLAGLTWGMEDLSAVLGASVRFDAHGLRPPLQLARTSCLLAAAGVGTRAIDGVYTDVRNAEGVRLECDAARGDGFRGKLAIHPDQVAIINRAFTATEAEVTWARRVLAAIDAAGGGVAVLDGQMIDRPHRVQAERILSSRGE